MRIKSLIEPIYLLNRAIVTPGAAEAVHALSRAVPEAAFAEIRARTGEDCLTWLIPENWIVHGATIRYGERTIVDVRNNPLYLKTYSLPFHGTVSREELLAHVTTEPQRPHVVPYDVDWEYTYRDRSWGFSLPYNLVRLLPEGDYGIAIDTELVPGEIVVGEWTLQGELPECLLLVGNVCHQGQVNDSVAGVAVGLELLRRLASRPRRRFSYRLIAVPEYTGSAAYLSRRLEEMRLAVGCIVLKDLGNRAPLALQASFRGDAWVDRVVTHVFRGELERFRLGGYREILGADEMCFNAQGIEIPSVVVSRCTPAGIASHVLGGLFSEYHSSADEPALLDEDLLQEAADVLESVLDVYETDATPVPMRPGVFYLYRYDLYSDFDAEPDLNMKKSHLLHLLNGSLSSFELADAARLRFPQVRALLCQFETHGLVTMREQTPLTQRYPQVMGRAVPVFNEAYLETTLGKRLPQD